MDEDEELYREMDPEDPFYMGDEEDETDEDAFEEAQQEIIIPATKPKPVKTKKQQSKTSAARTTRAPRAARSMNPLVGCLIGSIIWTSSIGFLLWVFFGAD